MITSSGVPTKAWLYRKPTVNPDPEPEVDEEVEQDLLTQESDEENWIEWEE